MKKITLAVLSLSALVPFHAFAELAIVRTSAPATAASGSHTVSGDGNFVAFSTAATNLVDPDGNEAADIFVRKLSDATLACVSKSNAGVLGNANSTNPSLSTDGRYVAFQSTASNLVASDTNGFGVTGGSTGLDIFVYDRTTSTIKRVSLAVNGAQTIADSDSPSISGDGSLVAFASGDPSLAAAPGSGSTAYVYIVTAATAGTAGSVVRVPLPEAPGRTDKKCANPSISADGKFVAYEYQVVDNLNITPQYFYQDVYVYDIAANKNIRLTGNPATDGPLWNGQIAANPSISDDGRLVAFESCSVLTIDKVGVDPSSLFFDAYVARIGAASISYRLASTDVHGTLGNSVSTEPVLSADGRYVSFQSVATNFNGGAVTNDETNIFRKELATGVLTHVAITPGNEGSFAPAISGDGSRVSFLSPATNLVADDNDNNSATDTFVATFPEGPTALVFDENGSATPMVDVTGNFTGRFPGSQNQFQADVAMDESGKVVAMGTVAGYTHPTKGPDVRVTGSTKTVNDTPTVAGSGNVKGGTLDGEPIGGSGKVAIPLMETATEGGVEYQDAVGSGSAMVEGERYKQKPTMVSVPAEPANVIKEWSVSLSVLERTNNKGKKYLAASATLYLPNGDRTFFDERKLNFSPKTGLYSMVFEKGIKLDQGSEPILVNGKEVKDRKSRLVVNKLEVEESGELRQATGGQLRYKFLGQKGSGNLLDFQ